MSSASPPCLLLLCQSLNAHEAGLQRLRHHAAALEQLNSPTAPFFAPSATPCRGDACPSSRSSSSRSRSGRPASEAPTAEEVMAFVALDGAAVAAVDAVLEQWKALLAGCLAPPAEPPARGGTGRPPPPPSAALPRVETVVVGVSFAACAESFFGAGGSASLVRYLTSVPPTPAEVATEAGGASGQRHALECLLWCCHANFETLRHLLQIRPSLSGPLLASLFQLIVTLGKALTALTARGAGRGVPQPVGAAAGPAGGAALPGLDPVPVLRDRVRGAQYRCTSLALVNALLLLLLYVPRSIAKVARVTVRNLWRRVGGVALAPSPWAALPRLHHARRAEEPAMAGDDGERLRSEAEALRGAERDQALLERELLTWADDQIIPLPPPGPADAPPHAGGATRHRGHSAQHVVDTVREDRRLAVMFLERILRNLGGARRRDPGAGPGRSAAGDVAPPPARNPLALLQEFGPGIVVAIDAIIEKEPALDGVERQQLLEVQVVCREYLAPRAAEPPPRDGPQGVDAAAAHRSPEWLIDVELSPVASPVRPAGGWRGGVSAAAAAVPPVLPAGEVRRFLLDKQREFLREEGDAEAQMDARRGEAQRLAAELSLLRAEQAQLLEGVRPWTAASRPTAGCPAPPLRSAVDALDALIRLLEADDHAVNGPP